MSNSSQRIEIHRQFGDANPTRFDHPFWHEMVKSGETAYAARCRLDLPQSEHGAIWCFRRFGPTRTRLPDGRTICIGGEHEDFYDEDFCIYNDVIVVQPNGELTIYGYPKDKFPPTDSHTATLLEDRILIVGNLGYQTERSSETPVFSLDLHSLAITHLHPRGHSPGWLYGHEATLIEGGRALRLPPGLEHCGIIDPKNPSPEPVPWTGAAELELDTLQWRSNPAPLPARSVLALDDRLAKLGWEAIEPERIYWELNGELEGLRVEVPPGHPLFACDVMPLAEDDNNRMLYRLLDGSERLAVVILDYLDRHAELPHPATQFYRDIEAMLLERAQLRRD